MSKLEVFLKWILPSNYIKWFSKILVLLLLLKPENKYLTIVYYFWKIPHVIFTCIWLNISECICIYNLWGDKIKVMLTITVTILHVGGAMRYFLWDLMQKRHIFKLVEIVDKKLDFRVFNIKNDNLLRKSSVNFKNCVNFSYNGLILRWRNVGYYLGKIETHNARNIIDEFEDKQELYAKSWCVFILVGYYIGLVVICSTAYLRKSDTYFAFNSWVNRTSMYKKLPFETYIPFDISLSDGHYNWVRIYQLYMYLGNVGTFLVLDSAGTNFVKLLQTKLKVINFAIRQIDKNIQVENFEANMFIREIRLTKCIDEIKLVIKGAKIFEELYNSILLVQNTMAVLMLCTCLFTSQLINTKEEKFYVTYMAMLVLFEPVFMAWYSTLLQEEFYQLLNAIYDLDWLNYSLSLRKKLVFMMMVFKKPPRLTLGGLVIIDMAFYLSFLKNSYSAYTLITATQGK